MREPSDQRRWSSSQPPFLIVELLKFVLSEAQQLSGTITILSNFFANFFIIAEDFWLEEINEFYQAFLNFLP